MLDILISSVTQGLLWSIMSIGIYVMFRLLDIADLSAEGTFTTGAAITAIIITMELESSLQAYLPVLATVGALLGGALAGLVAGWIHTKMNIPPLLTGILMQTGLYSVNLRIMGGKSNIAMLRNDTIFTPLEQLTGWGKNLNTIVVCFVIAVFVIGIMYWFLETEIGLSFRATGDNLRMSEANGINTNRMKTLGYMIANGIIALSGSLVVQYSGYSDMQMGIGTIATGLAAIVIAEVIIPNQPIHRRLMTIILGSIIYRLIIDIILNQPWINIQASDLRLLTAIILGIVLFLPELRKYSRRRSAVKGGH